MDAVILAGGRGQRMGALTRRKQKGTLRVDGRFIIALVLDDMLARCEIGTIHIGTGYRSEDVCAVLTTQYAAEVACSKIVLEEFPEAFGELPLFVEIVRRMSSPGSVLVRGVDTLLPSELLPAVVARSRQKDDIAVALSPNLNVAATHHRAYVRNDIIEAYDPRPGVPVEESGKILCDVGMRCFPARLVSEMSRLSAPKHSDFIEGFVKDAMLRGERPQAVVFNDPWRHFSRGADFVS